jgi:hypothetical protein
VFSPSPPGEKATACQDQPGQASTGDGAGNCYRGIDGVQKYVAGVIGRGDIQELKTPRIVNIESSLATQDQERRKQTNHQELC